MELTATFTHTIGLNGRRTEVIYVLAYETCKRLGYVFEHISAETIRCRYSGPGNRPFVIALHPGNEKLEWVCSMEAAGSGAAEAIGLFAAFEETLAKIAGIADEETLFEEHSALARQYFADPGKEEEVRAGLLSNVRPAAGYRVTPVIILINVLVYLVMVGSGVNWLMPDGPSLLNWGANFKPLTLNDEWWRILTSGFLHFGLIHLAVNMYALLQIGQAIERFTGSWRFLAAYCIALVTGSLLSLWWRDFGVSAGASGAVFGMYGVFLALLTTKLIARSVRRSLLTGIVAFVGFNLVFGMQGEIDNAAHIGGLLGGMFAGYAMVPALRKNSNVLKGTLPLAGLAAAVAALVFFVFAMLPNDYEAYEKRMNEIGRLEEKAIAVINEENLQPQENTLEKMQRDGIGSWKKCLQLTREIDSLNLPDIYKTQNTRIKTYCELRLASFELRYKALAERTTKYNAEIEACEKQVEAILKEMKK